MYLRFLALLFRGLLSKISGRNFFGIPSPLTRLSQKGIKFVCSLECEQSFKESKHWLIAAPIVILPSGGDGFKIYSEAGWKNLECVLMQNGKMVA